MMKVSEKVMHRLKGECVFQRKGNLDVCKVCGSTKDAPIELHAFSSGEPLMANLMNNNFQMMADAVMANAQAMRELEQKTADELKLIEESFRKELERLNNGTK